MRPGKGLSRADKAKRQMTKIAREAALFAVRTMKAEGIGTAEAASEPERRKKENANGNRTEISC